MSTDFLPANLQVPAHLADRLGKPSALAGSMVGGIGLAAFPRISFKGSRFRIVDGDTETLLPSTEIDVVIVGANPRLSKTWYEKAWSPDAEPVKPDCYSLDGIAPMQDSPALQNDLCATCPQNAWGSKINPTTGAEQKACSDLKRLAVVASDDPEGPIYLVQVTPAALKGLNQYQKELTMRGIPAEIVKTRLSFDTDASFPKLKFAFGGFLDAPTQVIVDGLFGSPSVMDVTGENTHAAPPPPVQMAPRKPSVAAIAAPKPAPVVLPPEEVIPPETQSAPVRKGFGGGATTTKAAAPAKAAVKPAAAKPVKVAPPVEAAQAAVSLADEIAALVGEVNADDA